MLVVYAGVIGFGLNEFRKTPIGFIPQLDRGYLIIVTQLPPAASLARTDDVNRARGRDRAQDAGRRACREHRGLFRRHLHQRAERGRGVRHARSVREARRRIRSSRPPPSSAQLFMRLQAIQEGLDLRRCAAAGAGIGNAGGFRMMVEDRAGRGSQALQNAVYAMMGRAAQTPGLDPGLFAVREHHAAALSRHRPRQGAAARHQRAGRVRRAADLSRLGLRQRLQSVRPHLPRGGAGAERLSPRHQGRAEDPGAQQHRRYRAARRLHHRAHHHRALSRAALQSLSGGRARRRGGARLQPGPGHPDHGETGRANAAGRLFLRVDHARLPAIARRQHRDLRFRAGGGVRVPGVGGTVREPDTAARGDPDRADVPDRLDRRRGASAARTTTS